MHNTKLLLAAFSIILLGVSCGQKEEAQVFNNSNQGTDNMAQETEAPQSAAQEMYLENQIITLKTSHGDIQVELFLKDAPITAGNFLKLAKENFYDGVTFHRVIPNFMIQGGDPLSKDTDPSNDGTGGPGYAIEDEFVPGLSNGRGTLSMANSGPNTGGSQFFINIRDNTFLDYDKEPLSSKHAVFGRVVQGMDVVDAISEAERDARDRPIGDVVIQTIVVE